MKRISFSYPLPQLIREGKKTQTRRILKVKGCKSFVPPTDWDKEAVLRWAGDCPYGKPGDILAVLEEHFMFGHWEPDNTRKRKTGRQAWKFVQDAPEILYRENPPPTYRKGSYSADPSTPAWHKRLARFMPSHAVRTYIQLTNIKAEQLKDISQGDAIAEGCFPYGPFGEYAGSLHPNGGSMKYRAYGRAQHAFRCIWESINGEGSYNPDLWVFALTFKLTEKP